MVKNNILGHEIYYDTDKEWKYTDTKELIKHISRKCVRCGEYPTIDGHDHCLGNLGKVINACCGHGVQEGYLHF